MAWNDPKYKTVSGVVDSPAQLESLLTELEGRGTGREFVDVVMSDTTRSFYSDSETSIEKQNKAAEGATAGGVSVGLIGAIVGGLTMAGSLLIPGLNVLVAGPIVGMLAGGAAGAAAGSLAGALVGAGIPEFEAKTYEKDLEKQGNVLVIAHVPKDEVNDVKELFKRHGAKNPAVQTDHTDEATKAAASSVRY